jgi:hypothetical protein
MRKYAPLYDRAAERWSIIFNDQYEPEWYVFLASETMTQSEAAVISDALNREVVAT